MKRKQTPILLWTAILTVLSYHAYPIVRGGLFRFSDRIEVRQMELRIAGKRVCFSVPHLRSSQKRLDSSSEFLAGIAFVLRYWGGETNDYAIKGNANPIQKYFLREDVAVHFPSQVPKVEKLAQELKTIFRDLDKAGVRTLLLPIPPKMAFYEDEFNKRLPPSDEWQAESRHVNEIPMESPYQAYRVLTESDPKHIVDLFTTYRHHNPNDPNHFLYVPWDYHWSSFGITVAAQAILESLKSQGIAVGRLGEPRLTGIRPAFFRDTLLYLTQLPDWFLLHSKKFDWREPVYDVDAVSGSPQGRLVIAGSSYTNRLRGTGHGLGKNCKWR